MNRIVSQLLYTEVQDLQIEEGYRKHILPGLETRAVREKLTYNQERDANIARNKEILRRVMDGESMDEIMASMVNGKSTTSTSSTSLEEPQWMQEAATYLEGVSSEDCWRELVTAWKAFERELGFPDGQVRQ